ncbi:hypothetical protein [Cupriavidus sp. BIC8F]|uniref:hypothetical protein n=1 Tax=Cupriavidus sp. BIC8F TaxID=3079014 RepID=UPI002916DF42|nr:hypothetical protein [Cupriavidus sp. BIC8F]
MIHELTPRVQVRSAGAEAFRRGKEADDNPHMPGTDAHLEWLAGFKGEQYRPADSAPSGAGRRRR